MLFSSLQRQLFAHFTDFSAYDYGTVIMCSDILQPLTFSAYRCIRQQYIANVGGRRMCLFQDADMFNSFIMYSNYYYLL